MERWMMARRWGVRRGSREQIGETWGWWGTKKQGGEVRSEKEV